MNYRQFGNTSLRVSEIGFGAWAIGGGAMIGNTAIGWGDANDTISQQAIHAAMDADINFFDTADIYGLGHSEELIGKYIGSRKDVIIASKVGNVSRDGKFTVDYSRQHIVNACEQSLKRLNREVIDFYQLHTARVIHLQEGECIEAMELLQRQGKIRYWGLSLATFAPAPDAEFLMKQIKGQGFQLVLNIINQRALPLLQPMQDHGYGTIARMALQFGLLTGKFSATTKFPDNDHRKNRLTATLIDHTQTLLNKLQLLTEKYQCSYTELALSYVLSHKAISTVIPGIRTAQQVKANTTGIFQLEEKDLQIIEKGLSADTTQLMEEIEKLG